MNNQFSIKRWTLATFLGWILGVAFILILSGLFDSIGVEGWQFYLGLGMGAGVGIVQWIFHRKNSSISYLWILFSVLGLGIPFFILDFAPIPYKLPISVALGSVIVAILQFTVLKKHFQKAFLWIFGCFFGWAGSVATVFTIDLLMKIKVTGGMLLIMALINLLLILAGGVVLGIISGFTLKRIEQQQN